MHAIKRLMGVGFLALGQLGHPVPRGLVIEPVRPPVMRGWGNSIRVGPRAIVVVPGRLYPGVPRDAWGLPVLPRGPVVDVWGDD
jgi:hypothetical protein